MIRCSQACINEMQNSKQGYVQLKERKEKKRKVYALLIARVPKPSNQDKHGMSLKENQQGNSHGDPLHFLS
ncbi:hypothetical protein HZ326_25815 [Fusarium oxysporum f. sp. albedinis]|nr:hypothetical protein HZ326_25815 [Fusarium oxysporum f. sp. albedinis]